MSKKTHRIRASFAFTKAADAVVVARGQAVLKGMTDNPILNTPPIDPSSLKTALDDFVIGIGDAEDGGKRARAERRRLREEVIRMLRILGHYAEAACNEDPITFMSSGFELLTFACTAAQPVEPGAIRKIVQGVTGQLLVKVNSVPKAWSYELRYASLDAAGAPGPWTSQPITAISAPTPCNGLTPGAIYSFQVRALGRLGFSDWSHTVTKMCT